jgi:long-chain acyl-CoA synthetase
MPADTSRYAPRFSNLANLYTQSIEKFASRPLFGVRKPEGWKWTTYAEFAVLVDAARAGLARLGVGHGDRVAVISNNRLEWAVCAYATYTRGAVYVPMYEAQLDKDWQYILADAGAKVCFVASPAIAGRIRAMQDALPELKHVIDFQDAAYAQLVNTQSEKVAPAKPSDRDLAMYIYTSGTTGNPKGVELTHYNLAANACGVLEAMPLAEHERSLAFLPWAHVFGGCIELNSGIMHGSELAICENTDKLLEQLPEVQPTMLFAVPRIWNRIYDGVQKQMAAKPKAIQAIFRRGMEAKSKQKQGKALGTRDKIVLALAEKLIFSKIRAKFGGKLRFAFSGAAALSREVAEFIDNLGIMVFEGYGLTESSGCTTASTPNARRLGAVGKPLPGIEIKLDKSAVGAGEGEGEILIYGSGVMVGYHNQPEATQSTITPDGGLRTGDLGRIDADGFLYITGRVKELYKLSNGKYVAPAPLEEKLQLSPYISQCVVVGSDKPHNVALIVPDMVALAAFAETIGLPKDPAQLLTDSRVKDLIRKEVDSCSREFKGFEAVHDFVLSSELMSTQNDMLTPTFKVKRRNVLKLYGSQLDALYK